MRSRLRLAALLGGVAVGLLLVPLAAQAQPPPPPPEAGGAATTTAPATSSAPPPAPSPTPPATVSAATENNPPPTLPSTAAKKPGDDLEPGQHFTIDPVADGVITAAGLGFAAILGLVLGTGEIKPTQPVTDPTTGKPDPSVLLSIDRGAVSQTFDPNANTLSDIGLYSAIGFTVVDTVLSGIRDGWDAGLVDAVMYAESISLTLTLTDITKIAVRRPRPFDYQQPDASSTNAELSFFSGHASTVAAITGTASYLAFVRSPHSFRPWLTLVLGTALTAFVSYERVRGGDHFPTDVITGAMAGAAVGVLVPHLHRHKTEAPSVWIGGTPSPNGNGGALTLTGFF